MARVKPTKQKTSNGANVGYEINFNRDFYRYTPPRPLEEIEANICGIETDSVRMLAEMTGSAVNSK
jgi:type I restriction enzyme M protein